MGVMRAATSNIKNRKERNLQTGFPWISVVASGGTESSYSAPDSGYRLHTFTSPGTFTVSSAAGALVDILLVGAGGGGGGEAPGSNAAAGGGGAGQYVYLTNYYVAQGSTAITVAAPGMGSFAPNSSFGSALFAVGGGLGASCPPGLTGSRGASGGGGSSFNTPAGGGGGILFTGSGNPGGAGTGNTPSNTGGGGGGAGGAGSGINPGAGVANSITGSPVTYAAGAAGTPNAGSVPAGAANTGNGGGGTPSTGNAGGSGIVVIRYKTA